MPTAIVDTKGTELYFVDSGPINSSNDYTTLFVFHGTGFNSEIFARMLPLGAAHNLRMVLVNRRDYSGSSKYTDEELQDFQEGHQAFLERIGLEVSGFLNWYLDHTAIPQIGSDGCSGGCSIMGWSMGIVTPMALLGQPDVIPEESHVRLNLYLRKFIIFDSPYHAFGYDEPPEAYIPFTDPSIPPEDMASKFAYWVSAHYNHHNINSGLLSGLDTSKRGLRPSIEAMSPGELAKVLEATAASRSDIGAYPYPYPVLKPMLWDQSRRAFFDERLAKSFLPALKTVFILCTESCWPCPWAYNCLKAGTVEHTRNGKQVRPITFVEMEGANHFVHWDEPERFLGMVLKVLEN